jgi:MarR family 2-MHQ and catechol resistance regulon transcriptional repressor
VGVRFASAPPLSLGGVSEAASLRVSDPLAHRALEALVRAEATLTRRLAADLDRIGVSATGFAMLVLLVSAGGELELRTIRKRLGASKATATEVLDTLESRGFCTRARLETDRRAVSVGLTLAGRNLVTHAFPSHAERVRDAFGVLDEGEKRQLAEICRKLDRAA